MVPFGLFHIDLSPNSFTRASSENPHFHTHTKKISVYLLPAQN
jgi:hypothetical protein